MESTVLTFWLHVTLFYICCFADNTLYFEPMQGPSQRNKQINAEKFSFASYYNDHMVLQQAPKKSTIWGFADTEDIGKKISLTLRSNTGDHTSVYETSIIQGIEQNKAVWSVQLSPRAAGGPYELNVSAPGASLTLKDVLFGDVWLCSGQSNMVFKITQMYKEMSSHEYNISQSYPNIRLFTVTARGSDNPLIDFASVDLHWSLPSPKTLPGFSATCWLFGRHVQETLNYPIGLITSAYGGTPDEAWSSPDALRKCGLEKNTKPEKIPKPAWMSDFEHQNLFGGPPQKNSVLWNGMIHPLLNLTIHGTLWYQGEADFTKSNYNCTFPAMISDWRSKFVDGTKGETDALFPFGFVQLGPMQGPAPGTIVAGFASIRWQQTANYGYVPNPKMPNTFMAVANDLADFDSPYSPVHYRDKETVGTRLAAAGLAQAYKLPTKYRGPMPTSLSMTESVMTITYDNGQTTLNVRNSWGFELCCPKPGSDANCDYDIFGLPWAEAPVISYNATSLTISTKNCSSEMAALRYNWRLSPCEYKMCAVYSVDNELPAPPMYITKNQLTLGRF